jgi:hypothetical protein
MGAVSSSNVLTDCSSLVYTQAENSNNKEAGWYLLELQNPGETSHERLSLPNPWTKQISCSGTTEQCDQCMVDVWYDVSSSMSSIV